MKTKIKYISPSLNGKLFKLFNDALECTPEELKKQISDAIKALDVVEEDEHWNETILNDEE